MLLHRKAKDVALLLEAATLLTFSAAAIRLLPFGLIGQLASKRLARKQAAFREDSITRIAWAVRAAAIRAPFRAVCYQQGLAAQMMLRRRGLDSQLYFGAAHHQGQGLTAHVWVRCGGIDVVGGEEAHLYPPLAQFPAPPKGTCGPPSRSVTAPEPSEP